MIWRVGAVLIASIVALPLLGVVSSLFTPQAELWRHLADTQLVDIFLNTLVLRTNGSVMSGSVKLAPGDEILVFPKVETKWVELTRGVTSILYQLAVAAGVLSGL